MGENIKTAVRKSLRQAVKSAEDVDGGDPDTFISATINGRKGSSKELKSWVEDGSDDSRIVSVLGRNIKISFSNGYDIGIYNAFTDARYQLDSVQRTLYREFGKAMSERGYDLQMEVSNGYAY